MTARKLHTVRWPPDGTETTKCIDVQSIHKTVFLYGPKQTYKQPLQCIYTHHIYVYDMLLLILCISNICANIMAFACKETITEISTNCSPALMTLQRTNLRTLLMFETKSMYIVITNLLDATVYCQSTSVNSCSPRVHSQGNVSNFWQMLPNAAKKQHVESYSLD